MKISCRPEEEKVAGHTAVRDTRHGCVSTLQGRFDNKKKISVPRPGFLSTPTARRVRSFLFFARSARPSTIFLIFRAALRATEYDLSYFSRASRAQCTKYIIFLVSTFSVSYYRISPVMIIGVVSVRGCLVVFILFVWHSLSE